MNNREVDAWRLLFGKQKQRKIQGKTEISTGSQPELNPLGLPISAALDFCIVFRLFSFREKDEKKQFHQEIISDSIPILQIGQTP